MSAAATAGAVGPAVVAGPTVATAAREAAGGGAATT